MEDSAIFQASMNALFRRGVTFSRREEECKTGAGGTSVGRLLPPQHYKNKLYSFLLVV